MKQVDTTTFFLFSSHAVGLNIPFYFRLRLWELLVLVVGLRELLVPFVGFGERIASPDMLGVSFCERGN